MRDGVCLTAEPVDSASPATPADPGEGTGCVLMAPWPVCRSENGPGPPTGHGGVTVHEREAIRCSYVDMHVFMYIHVCVCYRVCVVTVSVYMNVSV